MSVTLFLTFSSRIQNGKSFWRRWNLKHISCIWWAALNVVKWKELTLEFLLTCSWTKVPFWSSAAGSKMANCFQGCRNFLHTWLMGSPNCKVSIKLEVSKIWRTCSDLLFQILCKYAAILRTSHLLRVRLTLDWEEEVRACSLNF